MVSGTRQRTFLLGDRMGDPAWADGPNFRSGGWGKSLRGRGLGPTGGRTGLTRLRNRLAATRLLETTQTDRLPAPVGLRPGAPLGPAQSHRLEPSCRPISRDVWGHLLDSPMAGRVQFPAGVGLGPHPQVPDVTPSPWAVHRADGRRILGDVCRSDPRGRIFRPTSSESTE